MSDTLTVFFKYYCSFLNVQIYRTILFDHPVARESFEVFCVYAGRFSGLIPITFLTGFYVTQVVTRWWDQFMSLPWPDKVAFRLVSYIPGKVGSQIFPFFQRFP